MRAGDLRDRVPISAHTKTKDGEGVITAGYAEVSTIWANMKPGGGQYVNSKYGIQDESISMVMECRPNSVVTEMNRATFQSHTYEIRHVDRQRDQYTALLRRV